MSTGRETGLSEEQVYRLRNMRYIVSYVRNWTLGRDRKLSPRVLSRHALCFLMSGEMKLCVNRDEYVMQAPGIYYLSKEAVVAAEAVSTSMASGCIVLFSYEDADRAGTRAATSGYEFPFPLEVDYRLPPKVLHLLEQIQECGKRGELMKWRRTLLFGELMYHLAERRLGPVCADVEDAVRQTIGYMKRNYAQDIRFAQLARSVGISPSAFTREFRKVSGQTPKAFLTGLRLDRAKQLLAQTGYRMKQIAEAVGYRDELYFGRMFKKSFGIAPSRYREDYPQRIVALHPFLSDYLWVLGVRTTAMTVIGKRQQMSAHSAYMAERLQGTSIVGDTLRPDTIEICRLKPDLILVHRSLSDGERYRHLAPTLLVGDDDWKEQLRQIAAPIGRMDEANQWIERYDRKIGWAKQELASLLSRHRRVLIVRVCADELRLYGGKRQLGSVLYRELGFAQPDGVKLDSYYVKTSIEQLATIAADHILLLTEADEQVQHAAAQLQQTAVWRQLQAVRRKRVHIMNCCVAFHTPLANWEAIEQLVRHLKKTERAENENLSV